MRGLKRRKGGADIAQKARKYARDLANRLEGLDKITLILAIILFAIGIIMVYSITSISIYNGVKNDPSNIVIKTLMFGVAGVVALFIILLMPYKWLKNLSVIAVWVCPLLLIFTLLFAGGSSSSNVRSWFEIGSIKIQPAEFVKIGMILAIAWLFDKHAQKGVYYIRSYRKTSWSLQRVWQSFFGVLLYVGICSGLVLIQPDFGSALIIGLIGLVMFLATGVRWKIFKPVFYIGMGFLVVGGFLMGKFFPYQLERFAIWADPFNHAKGFQNVMGYTAIALGGMSGVGVGKSTQKYGYVLEPHNDMISTILAEELGVFVVILIMVAYFIIAFRCFSTALRCKDRFSALVAVGVGAIFLAQPFVNLGGASGAIPLTGVTLPLISYGGSSLVSMFLALGVYLNISMEQFNATKRLKEEREQSMKKKIVPLVKG